MAWSAAPGGTPDRSRALCRAEVEQLLTREDISLRERVFWRMLYSPLTGMPVSPCGILRYRSPVGGDDDATWPVMGCPGRILDALVGHRQLRKLVIQVDVEPAGKGPAGRRSAPEFQRQVMDQMECYRRYPITGPVALDLHFRAARKNPPTVQRAAKHTLDILGAALPGCERPRRRNVLWHDDRQVKFLYAGLDQSWMRNSSEDGRPGSVSSSPGAPAT